MHHSSFIRDNRATIVAALIVAAVVAALFARTHSKSAEGRLVAFVHDSTGAVHELPLDTPTTLRISTDLGTNVIVVEGGAVRVDEADCPQGTCTLAHPLSSPGGQIICLPHQLWIEVAPEGSEAGEMDVSRAEDVDPDVDLVAR